MLPEKPSWPIAPAAGTAIFASVKDRHGSDLRFKTRADMLVQVEQLIIVREAEATRLQELSALAKMGGVRRPQLIAASERCDQALVRLARLRSSLF
jgi:hypothetical protein